MRKFVIVLVNSASTLSQSLLRKNDVITKYNISSIYNFDSIQLSCVWLMIDKLKLWTSDTCCGDACRGDIAT